MIHGRYIDKPKRKEKGDDLFRQEIIPTNIKQTKKYESFLKRNSIRIVTYNIFSFGCCKYCKIKKRKKRKK